MGILVTWHAIEAFKRRLHDLRGYRVIEEEIAKRVLESIEANRIADRKTKPFRQYGEAKATPLFPNERFVWDGDVGWIVRLKDEQRVVVTTVVRARAA